MMHTVLPREEAVEAIFSKIVASPASCEQLREVVYEHLEDEQIFEKNQAEHFTEVLFQAYKNGDISALLLELCGRSMFDLLREAYLIPKKFHGKAGENPVLLTDVDGNLLARRQFGKFFLHHFDFRTRFADQNARTRGVNGDGDPLRGALDHDLGNRSLEILFFQERADFVILFEVSGKILFACEPLRVPILDDPYS